MSADWLKLTQDILVVLFMLALRVGVPLLILFALGAWLKKLFEPQTTSSEELAKAKRQTAAALWNDKLLRRVRSIQARLRRQFIRHV